MSGLGAPPPPCARAPDVREWEERVNRKMRLLTQMAMRQPILRAAELGHHEEQVRFGQFGLVASGPKDPGKQKVNLLGLGLHMGTQKGKSIC